MAEIVEQPSPSSLSETDLVAAVKQVLQNSEEPLTLSKLRAGLPSGFRNLSLEALEENLQRQVAAKVLYQYPKYRSQQNRYWDRPMRDHLVWLLRTAIEERALTLSDLRRKLPDYAKTQIEAVLEEEVAKGSVFRHPPLSSRSGPRYGMRKADPKDYLRQELSAVFLRLQPLGFSQEELREGALELLHDEEWAPGQEQPEATSTAEQPEGSQAPSQEPAASLPPAEAERPAAEPAAPQRAANQADEINPS
jgi:hypothetical protein